MDGKSVDRIARLLADRRMSRRQALAARGAGLAAASGAVAGSPALTTPVAKAQDATPEVLEGGEKVEYLFVQSFQRGRIVPKPDSEDLYELTLEQGLGQTIYFSDRPDRIVGAGPTDQFLDGLGFSEENPPNAALVLGADEGTTDVAVVELFNPVYDTTSHTATYDVKGLADYEKAVGMTFAVLPPDLSALPAEFGAAHLFIDDCADGTITCGSGDTNYPCPNGDVCGQFPNEGFCFNFPNCIPCRPYYHNDPPLAKVYEWWANLCNSTFPSCQEDGSGRQGCYPYGI